MIAKDFLNQYWLIDRRVGAKFEQIQQLRALAERRTAAYGVLPGRAAAPDRRMDIAARIVDEERKLDREIDEMLERKREIAELISRIPDERMRLLLEYRYINGRKWQDIADELCYDRTNVWRLHRAALGEVEKRMEASRNTIPHSNVL